MNIEILSWVIGIWSVVGFMFCCCCGDAIITTPKINIHKVNLIFVLSGPLIWIVLAGILVLAGVFTLLDKFEQKLVNWVQK